MAHDETRPEPPADPPEEGQADAAYLSLRRRAEDTVTGGEPEATDAPSPDDARRMLHELRVHQVELEVQNEELRRAHEALERVQARYFELYDLAPVGYLTLTEKGLVEQANLTAATLLGTTRAALVGQPLSRFVHPDDADRLYLDRRRLREGRQPDPCQLRLRRGDDEWFWARLDSTAAEDPETGATLVRTVITDVTAQKKAEHELRESERRLMRAQSIARIGDWEWDPATGAAIWSDEVYRLFGLEPGRAEPSYELAGSLVHPEDLERWEQVTGAWLEPGGPTELEYRVRRADGATVWVRNEVEVKHDRSGAPMRVVGTVQDITERLRAVEALRESERRFRETIENVDLIAVALDTRGCMTFVNDETLRLTGWSRDEVLGRDWFDTFLPAAERDEVRKTFLRTVEEGSFPPHYDNPILTRGGEERIVHWSNATLRDPDGRVSGTFSLGEDRTEVAAAEASLRASEERYRTLFQTMRQGVFYQAAGGELLDANPAALEMFGVTLEELCGRTSSHPGWDVVREDGTPLPAAEHPSMVALATGRPVRDVVAAVLNPAAGSRVWLSVNAVPEFRPGEDAPFRVAVTLHDLTEQKRAESELTERLEELRRWHAVTLEREGRILELKREVNQVLARAGQAPRYVTTAAGDTDRPSGDPLDNPGSNRHEKPPEPGTS